MTKVGYFNEVNLAGRYLIDYYSFSESTSYNWNLYVNGVNMRKKYNETGPLTPAEKIGNWVFDRLWRLFFVAILSVAFWFLVSGVVNFANFVQGGGEFGTNFYDPDPDMILGIRIIGALVIGFFVVHKRV